MNIHDLDMSAAKTIQMIIYIGGTVIACVVLIIILNMSRKIDSLKKEIKTLQDK
jgi:hypothetical protein